MRKFKAKSKKKIIKNDQQNKFEAMVAEYHEAVKLLDSLAEGSPEHIKHKEHCESLFSKAERFFNRTQK